MFATVIISARQKGIGNGLTYGVPAFAKASVGGRVGDLVTVPFRRSLVEGIIVDISEEKPEGDFDIREISKVLSDAPLLDPWHIDLARTMSEYYACPLRDTIGLFLPGKPWSALLPRPRKWVRFISHDTASVRGKKQQMVIAALQGRNEMVWEQIRQETGASREVLSRLQERGIVEIFQRLSDTSSDASALLDVPQPCLSMQQEDVVKAIRRDQRPALLFGVTGSGKTEIYAALIRQTIESGKSAVLLLPEILLTESIVGRFRSLLEPEAIALVHSRCTLSERRDAWQRCRSGQARLVIGSRSALFAPLKDCGLIIVDEEHEWTYKNEQSPRYHAVHAAAQYCRRIGARLVLGSATPSVDSWQRAMTNEFQLVELTERYGGATLPSVQIIDLGSMDCGTHYPLSPSLIQGIRTRLERKEQCVLFLNRRGFASSLLCTECRYRFSDPETKLSYTVHHRGSRSFLMSHHTGAVVEIPDRCPQCGSSSLLEVGAGTQRVDGMLQNLFPDARIARADSDTLGNPEQMRSLLERMGNRTIDLLLGTQGVVKGLDFPSVTLAAVIMADIGLSLPHYRAGERIFQLLSQLAGRSGRRTPGEVIIQTYRPNEPEIIHAANHTVRTYLNEELERRKHLGYPPAKPMIRVSFQEKDAEKRSGQFLRLLREKTTDLQISRSPSLFKGHSVWHVLIRGADVRRILPWCADADVVDVDPVSCL